MLKLLVYSIDSGMKVPMFKLRELKQHDNDDGIEKGIKQNANSQQNDEFAYALYILAHVFAVICKTNT